MNKIHYFLVIIILFGCTNLIGQHHSDPIIIGTYCGECEGQCFQGFYISGDSIYRISASYIDKIDLTKKEIVLDTNIIKKILNIKSLIPSDLNKYSHVIGEPDSRDQCGIYIKSINKITTKEILIDPDKPSDFKDFSVEIQKLLQL